MSSPADDAAAAAPEPAPARRIPRRLLLALWLPVGIALAVFVLTFAATRPPGTVDTPTLGRPAPAFDLATLDGGRLKLASLQGSLVVVNFWASWCIPCRDEAPLFAAADREFGPAGVRIVGIVYQDSAENARGFMRQYEQTYPGLLDPDGRTAIDYGVFGIPETFFIDRDGIVRYRQIGAVTGDELRTQIEALLR